MRTIIDCQQAGKYQERDATSLAISAWAAVHGLALLLINNQLRNWGWGQENAEEIVRQLLEVLKEGLLRR